MKTINGITFCDDYDEYEITESDIDIMKIRFCFMWENDSIADIWIYGTQEIDLPRCQDAFEKALILGETSSNEDNLAGIDRAKFLLSRFYMFADSLAHPHSGDCTNECHACIRCQTERLLNLDTFHKIKTNKEKL